MKGFYKASGQSLAILFFSSSSESEASRVGGILFSKCFSRQAARVRRAGSERSSARRCVSSSEMFRRRYPRDPNDPLDRKEPEEPRSGLVLGWLWAGSGLALASPAVSQNASRDPEKK